MSNKDLEKERREHASWCLKNGIKIYAEAIVGKKTLRIVIDYKGKLIKGEGEYVKNPTLKKGEIKWWVKIEQLRKHYYDKEFKNN